VIPRVTLLAALGNVSTSTAETPVIDNPMTIPVNIITETLRRAAAHAAAPDDVSAMKGASA
jgi:glycine betaine/proline transport system ATP-binding protein